MIDWKAIAEKLIAEAKDPSAKTRQAVIAVLIVLGVVTALWFLMWSIGRPHGSPELGELVIEKTQAQTVQSQQAIDQAMPVLETKVFAPITQHIERTKPYVAKLQARVAAPSPPGAAYVPDDDFYDSVCQPGGLYQGHPERSGPCGRP